METEKEKTFIPYPGDYINAVVDLFDGNYASYGGFVVRQAHGFSISRFPIDPIVFNVNGELQPHITDVTVIRNHKIIFSYSKDNSNNSTPDNSGSISDGYHTFDELYYYRMLYNAMAVNMLYRDNFIPVFKSKKHHDGTPCFDGRYFIVQMELPTGYVANHYELKYWDLFNVSEQEKAPIEYDGSTPDEESERIHEYLEQWNTLY